MSYGTGAIMAVPGHDTRDWEFARKYGLPIVEVVLGGNVDEEAYVDIAQGTMVNSGFLDGLPVQEAIERTLVWLEQEGHGRRKVNYKLRDWVFSRQRYWGEPIPLIHCESCGWVPVPDAGLPLLLPEVKDFRASEGGESPLASVEDWVAAPCPQCGGPGRRETDTMPQWAGSCWYFLRYVDPHNGEAFADRALLDYWTPVDWYNGGMEHTVLHLLYSRFWHKVLYDEGLVPSPEPYLRRTSHGMILGEDNEKMSKSRGNVVNPDDVVAAFGADTFRTFEMYLGAFDQASAWSEAGVKGVHRFLNRVWALRESVSPDAAPTEDDERLTHFTIKAVGERIEKMKFNTAVAALMTYSSELARADAVPLAMMRVLCILLHPFAPHLTDELWEQLGEAGSPGDESWPAFDPELAKAKVMSIPIQVNGKLRDTVDVEYGIAEDELVALALAQPRIQAHVGDRPVRRAIYVEGRLLNLVI